jgi:hypothetical protein
MSADSIDAERIPYIALPQRSKGHPRQEYLHQTGLRIGDYALIINENNGKYCSAVFADSKNKPNLGEVSIRAASLLGAPTSARHGSLPRGIIKVILPGSGDGQGFPPPGSDIIEICGKAKMREFSTSFDRNKTLALSLS